ncbi:MAG: 50S ribosomal protein L4 [Actinomycetota bacterium]|nr:50S ribosomal protein L4 [Actinomycetota bacterium]
MSETPTEPQGESAAGAGTGTAVADPSPRAGSAEAAPGEERSAPRFPVHDGAGNRTGEVDADPAMFAVRPNVALMHQVVTAQLAAARSGTHSTRTRSEARGGGTKPWRQKGTGRARQGSIRAPQWRGGGVALGPKPRSYRQRTPKKMVRGALASALSDRAAEGRIVVVASWDLSAPSTKTANAVLAALGVSGRALVVLPPGEEIVRKSLRNLPNVHTLSAGELNAYDVLCSDWVVFTGDTLPAREGR